MSKKLVAFGKSPLVDAVIEVRFQYKVPEMVPGLVYSALNKQFKDKGEMTDLPILQLPQPLREADPNLKFQPTHKLKSSPYYLNIGPNVVGFGYSKDTGALYPGWKKFFNDFKEVAESLKEADVLKNIQRVGVRYVSLFQQDDLFEGLNIEFKTGWEEKGLHKDRAITFFVEDGNVKSKVQINTASVIQIKEQSVAGQVIDIDAALEKNLSYGKLYSDIEAAHKDVKGIFESLLNETLLTQIGAKYE